MPTIKDVAKRAHVSVSTVSKAFSDSTDISERSRELVLKTAQEMGYKIKKYNKQYKGNLALFVYKMDIERTDYFGYEIIFGFQSCANQNGYNVKIINIEENNQYESFTKIIKQNKFDGAFLLGLSLDTDYIEELKGTSVPSVVLDNYIDNKRVMQIGSDSSLGIQFIVEHLSNFGHKNIAMLSGEEGSLVARERKIAFESAMYQNNIPVSDSLVAYSDFHENQAEIYVEQFIKEGASAIVCASDMIAINVINYLEKINLRVPEDISVTGFDNIPASNAMIPKLTTVNQNCVAIGKMAFTSLIELINGMELAKIMLRPELIVRESTGKVGLRGRSIKNNRK